MKSYTFTLNYPSDMNSFHNEMFSDKVVNYSIHIDEARKPNMMLIIQIDLEDDAEAIVLALKLQATVKATCKTIT